MSSLKAYRPFRLRRSTPVWSPGARRRGFTLIELMVAMAVSSIVVLGIFAFTAIQQSTSAIHRRNVRTQQALEGAMWAIGQDVRQAGLGFARLCTELRVLNPATGLPLNPGAYAIPASAPVDAVTGQPHWVLRDGLQAFWNSDVLAPADIANGQTTSAHPNAPGDAFDVIFAEANYMSMVGVFALGTDGYPTGGNNLRIFTDPDVLDNTNPADLNAVRQLFPPGSFALIARMPGRSPSSPTSDGDQRSNPLRPEHQGQCLLVQVTGTVWAAGAVHDWGLPTLASSDFNAVAGGGSAAEKLFLPASEDPTVRPATASAEAAHPAGVPTDANLIENDWFAGVDGIDCATDNSCPAMVLPLGRLRWSRYEIDYTIRNTPYLVRYDIIGHKDGVDATNWGTGGVQFAHCTAGACPEYGLHLPGTNDPPIGVAIGPMIEDMQVTVGCDGYTLAGAAAPDAVDGNEVNDILPPDGAVDRGIRATSQGFDGSTHGRGGLDNNVVDEYTTVTDRRTDEWLGNMNGEVSAPDCVYYGGAQFYDAAWDAFYALGPDLHRMSPQAIRISLVGSSETAEGASVISDLGADFDKLPPLEDRPVTPGTTEIGKRRRIILTERFSPKNVRWRDPVVRQ